MLFKKMIRTLKKYAGQFLSMILIVGIGSGVYIGFNMEWRSVYDNTEYFFEETNFADYRIYSELGYTKDEIQVIQQIPGIELATRYLNVVFPIVGTEKKLGVLYSEENNVSKIYPVNDTTYDDTAVGIYISDKFAKTNGYKLGDKLTFSYEEHTLSFPIIGFCKSSEYLVCLESTEQVVPDYEAFGYAYITTATFDEILKEVAANLSYFVSLDALKTQMLCQINIKSNLTKNEIKSALSKALGYDSLVVEKVDFNSYRGRNEEIREGKLFGQLIPYLFLTIAILTMVTTMHRITLNEKSQIGILQALGFKNSRIFFHYASFAWIVSILGSILGLIIGRVLALIIMNPVYFMGTFLDMPTWNLTYSFSSYLLLIILALILSVVAGCSVLNLLKGNPADTLRPYVAVIKKQLKIEKTKSFRKLGFTTRWNLRDLIRHPSRTLTTLIGTIGCTMLVIAGLGLLDSFDSFTASLENTVYSYETKVSLNTGYTIDEIEDLKTKYSADSLARLAVVLNEKSLMLDIYDNKNALLNIVDEDRNPINMISNGAYVCLRIAEEQGIKIGDTIKIQKYGTQAYYELEIVGFFRSSIIESISIDKYYAKDLGIDYTMDSLYTNTLISQIEDDDRIQSVMTKNQIVGSIKKVSEIIKTMCYLVVVCSFLLTMIVLYNLGIMSYMERYKELSTLKVLGFEDRKISKILLFQSILLSLIGLVIALPFSKKFLSIIVKYIAVRYEMITVIDFSTILIAVGLIFMVSILVSIVISKKNKNIDMVASLKANE